MTGLTAKQVHERIGLVSATLALAFTGTLPWWEMDGKVYSGWAPIADAGRSAGIVTGQAIAMFGTSACLMALLIGAALVQPDSYSARVARWIGVLAGVLTGGLCFLMLAGGESSESIDLRGGLLTAAIAAAAVASFWKKLAATPRPASEAEATKTGDDQD